MVSGRKEFKDRRTVIGYVEKEEFEIMEEIRWREHHSESEILRKAYLEYIQNHREGNNSFSLDKWNENSDFKAIPTLLSRSETWYQYLTECTDKELTDIMIATTRINRQCQQESQKRR